MIHAMKMQFCMDISPNLFEYCIKNSQLDFFKDQSWCKIKSKLVKKGFVINEMHFIDNNEMHLLSEVKTAGSSNSVLYHHRPCVLNY